VAKARPAVAAPVLKDFQGSVYGFAVTGETVFAASSQGLLRSATSGLTWSAVPVVTLGDVRFVASAKMVVAAASLGGIEISVDGGSTWKTASLPAKVTQVSALAVDGRGGFWVGDKDGVYVSGDKGATWQVVANLGVRNVNSLYFDEAGDRILIAAKEPPTDAFAVDVATKRVSSWDTGWNLRLLRPVGDHLVAATLFDGIVVQPRMVDSALVGKQ
jgi:photosystem II stability/assembly factor-like uncharacterized protein